MIAGSSNSEKESIDLRPELFEPTRLSQNMYKLHATRNIAVNIIAHECMLLALSLCKLYGLSTKQKTAPRIGIIGAGAVGITTAMVLLQHHYPTTSITISTRQPQKIIKCDAIQTPTNENLFHQVERYFDNVRLSESSDIIILCVPPSQVKTVMIEIKSVFTKRHPVPLISVLCGVPVQVIQKLYTTTLVIRTKLNITKLKDEHRNLCQETYGQNTVLQATELQDIFQRATMELLPTIQDIDQLEEYLKSFIQEQWNCTIQQAKAMLQTTFHTDSETKLPIWWYGPWNRILNILHK